MIRVHKNKLHSNQSGMAAILITMVMMVVISLIVLAFGQISRREQRSALDRQLSTQAFYAAESGVNDAVNAISNSYLATYPKGKTSCGNTDTGPPSPGNPFTKDSNINVLDSGAGIEYTCLLINPRPSTLSYTLSQDPATVVPIQTVDTNGNHIAPNYVNVSWQNSSGNITKFSGCPGNFPKTSQWNTASKPCGASVLRMDIISSEALTGTNSRSNLQNDVMTVFLRPYSRGGTPSIPYSYPVAADQNGKIISVGCNSANTYACNVHITDLDSGLYFLRLQSVYSSDESVKITATASGGSSLYFSGAQALIDSTGKANDVLRRIQVAVPLSPVSTDNNPFVIQSTSSVCKRFYLEKDLSGNYQVIGDTGGIGNTDTTSCWP